MVLLLTKLPQNVLRPQHKTKLEHKKVKSTISVLTLLFISDFLYAQDLKKDQPPPPQKSVPSALTGDVAQLITPPVAGRIVTYRDGEIVTIVARLRFTSTIRLPSNEEIVDVAGGDTDNWPADWAGNVVSVKCTLPNSSTNISLLCRSGHVYSFVLVEQSKRSPDLLITIKTEDQPTVLRPKFVSATELNACQLQLADAQKAMATAAPPAAPVPTVTLLAPDTVATGEKLINDYSFDKQRAKRFGVSAIYHTEKFTYIDIDPQEKPAIYALVDKKHDHLVEPEYDRENHRWRITGVLDRGYLKIGREKFKFERKG